MKGQKIMKEIIQKHGHIQKVDTIMQIHHFELNKPYIKMISWKKKGVFAH